MGFSDLRAKNRDKTKITKRDVLLALFRTKGDVAPYLNALGDKNLNLIEVLLRHFQAQDTQDKGDQLKEDTWEVKLLKETKNRMMGLTSSSITPSSKSRRIGQASSLSNPPPTPSIPSAFSFFSNPFVRSKLEMWVDPTSLRCFSTSSPNNG